MANFIYVFSKEARDKLTELQFQLIKEDYTKGIFVFLCNGEQRFSEIDFQYALSDILTF